MRMRKKKHGAERLARLSHLLASDRAAIMSDPSALFGEKRRLALEIGCGKGDFAVGMSAANPDCNFYAMERISDVVVIAAEKAEAAADSRPDNLRFIVGDAKDLAEIFPASCLDAIYINFCDPWTKKGHTKRRLTYSGKLLMYKDLLLSDGNIFFKTDDERLFDFSLEEFEKCGYELVFVTRDLHASERAGGNIMTEYERNFSSQGMPIFSLQAKKKGV